VELRGRPEQPEPARVVGRNSTMRKSIIDKNEKQKGKKMKTKNERSPRTYRPLLSIEPIIKVVTRKFEIKETSANLITEYAQYMSERSGSSVKEDAVVEHLALLVGKDKGFKDWTSRKCSEGWGQ
jgi:hypothetical protein